MKIYLPKSTKSEAREINDDDFAQAIELKKNNTVDDNDSVQKN